MSERLNDTPPDDRLHGIQLEGLRVIELNLNVHDLDAAQRPGLELPVRTTVGVTEFDEEAFVIGVGLVCTLGDDGSTEGREPSAFFIKVHILGQFKVDLARFPRKHVLDWAQKNAPVLLLPFLREHIYGLALRAGIKDIILPLVTLPVYRLPRENNSVQSATNTNNQ